MIILLSLTSLHLQWKQAYMCCIFNDLSYSGSEVILWWNAIEILFLFLSLFLSFTRTPLMKAQLSSRDFLVYYSSNVMTVVYTGS